MTVNNHGTVLSVQIVAGGFVLVYPTDDGLSKTEVFTSQGKLMKKIRDTVDAFSLVKKAKDEGEADAE